MEYMENMTNNLIRLYRLIRFGLSNPYLFKIEYHDFHIAKLPIVRKNMINKFTIRDSGCCIIKQIDSTKANPKIPFNWHSEFGIKENIPLLISEFKLYRQLTPLRIIITDILENPKAIEVKIIENNTINFLDLKSSLLFFIILTSVIPNY